MWGIAMDNISPRRRREIIDALRRGTVPQRGLDVFAAGLGRFEDLVDSELRAVAEGGASFKAIRGDYGSGKTFFGRWLQEGAKRRGFATSEVQISEADTPLHRLETVYRRAMERLSTAETFQGALPSIIDGWFYGLEEEVLGKGEVDPGDSSRFLEAVGELLDRRLSAISKITPQFALALRGYRRARAGNDAVIAEGLLGWLAGQPQVGAPIKRFAGLKGDVDHFAAMSFLQGLLTILRESGFAGLVLVLDEIETLQRVRGDVREKGLNALRQLVDEVDAGRFPGLYLVITGTPAFYDGPQGIRRLEPLAQRLHVDFQTDARFDNLRAVQIRLSGFSHDRLVEVGTKIRDLYVQDAAEPDRVLKLADGSYIDALARAVTGDLGGSVGVAPRLFLKKLVGDVLDRIEQHAEFDPRRHYRLTIADHELTRVERSARGAAPTVDDIDLEL
jgi:hypothetical protein